jgi:IS5 family transposase
MDRNAFTFADFDAEKRIEEIEHVLKEIDRITDWNRIDKIVSVCDFRNSSHYGRDSFAPLTMFRIFLIQRMHGFSDRMMASYLKRDLLFMSFCRLSFNTPVPDYSTICRWRDRFVKHGIFQKVFDDFNAQLAAKGYNLNNATIVDATLIKSAARPHTKVFTSSKEASASDTNNSETVITCETSKDPDATWKKKGKTLVYGFQGFAATTFHGLIKHFHLTPANVYEGSELPKIIESVSPSRGSRVYADKGYASEANSLYLTERGLGDRIMRKLTKKPELNEHILMFNSCISSIRFPVERTFGTLKRMYGMHRSIYMGLEKTQNWGLLTGLIYNMKKSLKLPQDNCVQT